MSRLSILVALGALVVLAFVSQCDARKRKNDHARPFNIVKKNYNGGKKHHKHQKMVSSIYNPDPKPAPVHKCNVKRPDFCPIGVGKHRAIADDVFKWPRGIVPYEFGNIQGYYEIVQAVKQAFSDLSATTCIQFVERTNQKDYLHFRLNDESDEICWSRLGRWGGMQEVALGRYCGTHKGPIIHELMHALGFEHEQSRIDRDQYVRINFNNIPQTEWHQFNIMNGSCDTDPTITLVPYSYSSIMHYGEYLFAIDDNVKTIVPTQGYDRSTKIGDCKGLDQSDIARIRKYYQCDGQQSSFKGSDHGYLCQLQDGNRARDGEFIKADGIAYKCSAESKTKVEVEPYGCLNGTGAITAFGNVFCDNGVAFRCVRQGDQIGKRSEFGHNCGDRDDNESDDSSSNNSPSDSGGMPPELAALFGRMGGNNNNGRRRPSGMSGGFPAGIFGFGNEEPEPDSHQSSFGEPTAIPKCTSEDGQEIELGDLVQSKGIWEQCDGSPFGGSVQLKKVACADEDGQKLGPGSQYVSGGFAYRCASGSQGVYRQAVACVAAKIGSAIQAVSPGQPYQLKGRWMECYQMSAGELGIRPAKPEFLRRYGLF